MDYSSKRRLEYIAITILQIVGLIAINSTSWGNSHIVILLIIAFIINIIAFNSLCRKPKYKTSKDEKDTHKLYEPPPFEENTIEIKDKSQFWLEDMTTAKFNNGKVYCVRNTDTYHIGNYRIDGDHVHVSAKDDREIGRVSLNNGKPNLIWLSNVGWYERAGLKNYNIKPLTLIVAEIYILDTNDIQIILDDQTNDVVAIYKGDPVGAAAAFICLQYECSCSGKCHDFYHDH